MNNITLVSKLSIKAKEIKHFGKLAYIDKTENNKIDVFMSFLQ